MNRIGLSPRLMGQFPLMLLAIVAVALSAGCTQSRGAPTQSWSGIAVADGAGFVGTREGRLIRLEIDSGMSRVAPFKAPEPDQDQGFPGIYGTPSVANGRVYIGTYNGTVFSLDAKTLGGVQSFEIDGNPLAKGIAGTVVPHEGSLVVAAAEDADQGRVYVLEADSLVETCRYPARGQPAVGQIWSTPVVHEGIAYFGDLGHSLHAVSIADCKPVWFAPAQLGGAIVAKPVIVAKKLYLGAFDRTFYEIDRATGAVQALFDATGWFWGGATSDGTRIYVPNLDGNIYAWHIADGRLAWISPGDGSSDSILATPVVFGDGSPYSPYMLAYASDSGVMVVVRARDGQREWDRRVGDEVRGPLTIDGRLVFLHSLDETVSAIDIETKQLAWARDLDDIR